MECQQLGVDALQEGEHATGAPGVSVDPLHCHGMDRWHGDTRSELAWRSVWRSFGLPEVGLRKVVAKGVRVKNDLGRHAVLPLGVKECFDLQHRPRGVIVRATHRYECRVPIPLVGVQGGGWFCIRPCPVLVQDTPGLFCVVGENSGHGSHAADVC